MIWSRRETTGPRSGPRTGWRGEPARAADGAVRRALRGAVLLALVWIALARLGLFDLVGVPELRWLPVGVLVGMLLGWRRWLAPVWGLAAAAVVLLLVVSATPVMRAPVTALVAMGRDPTATTPDDPADADAIFVFSSAMTDAGLVAGQGPERLLYALALARASGRPLVVSAIHPQGPAKAASSLADQQGLAALAGLTTPLVVIDSVGSTRDEAVRLAALARARGWRTLAVVTSPLHARRACAAVARMGLIVRCRPSPSRELTLAGPFAMYGTEQRVRAFGLWAYEWIGWWRYRAKGWV